MSFGIDSDMETTLRSWSARLKSMEQRVRSLESAPLVGDYIISDAGAKDNQTIKYKAIDGIYQNGDAFSTDDASDGDVLVYDADGQAWTSKATTEIETDITTTGEVTAQTLHIDETAVDLTVDDTNGMYLQCSDSWNKDQYLCRIFNNDDDGSTGDTLWVKGGANSSLAYALVVEQLNGNNMILCRGDGKVSLGNGIPESSYDVRSHGSLYADTLLCDDDAYASDWDGSVEVPTKNAVYDKISDIEGGWSDASLTFSANGTTWTPGTAPFARYKIIGKTVFLQCETGSGNVGATTGNLIVGGLPAAPNSNYSDRVIVGNCYIRPSSGNREVGHVLVDNSPAELNIFRADFSNFTTTAHPYIVHFSVVYEAA